MATLIDASKSVTRATFMILTNSIMESTLVWIFSVSATTFANDSWFELRPSLADNDLKSPFACARAVAFLDKLSWKSCKDSPASGEIPTCSSSKTMSVKTEFTLLCTSQADCSSLWPRPSKTKVTCASAAPARWSDKASVPLPFFWPEPPWPQAVYAVRFF